MISSITSNLCKEVASDLVNIGNTLSSNFEQIDQEKLASLKEKYKETTETLLSCASSSEIRFNEVEINSNKRKLDLAELNSVIYNRDISKIEDILSKKSKSFTLYPNGHASKGVKSNNKMMDDEINTFFTNTMTDINSKISQKLPSHIPSIRSSKEWKELDKVMLDIDRERDDDLILVSSNEFTESMTKCPYTSQTMLIPLKKYIESFINIFLL